MNIKALHILRAVSNELLGKWYTIMIDKTTTLSTTEQMVCCLFFVDYDLEVHKKVIGLYCLECTTAEMVTATFENVLVSLNFRIDNRRGQWYDWASNMPGTKSGVAARLTTMETKAVHIYCYCHALTLTAQDAIRNPRIMGEGLDTGMRFLN